jgi:hypothetical protein
MKNCTHISKLRLWVDFFWWNFFGHYYWYTPNESRAIWKFKIFGWKFIKNMCFFIFPAIKANYLMYFFINPIPNERECDFVVGHYTIFSDFFCLVMSYEPQTWGPMVDKKLHIIYVVYTNFIQLSSSNHWIEINLNLKWNLSSKMLLCTF